MLAVFRAVAVTVPAVAARTCLRLGRQSPLPAEAAFVPAAVGPPLVGRPLRPISQQFWPCQAGRLRTA